jgi:hypothetical protein
MAASLKERSRLRIWFVATLKTTKAGWKCSADTKCDLAASSPSAGRMGGREIDIPLKTVETAMPPA